MVGSANASQSVLVTLYPSVPLQWSGHATLSFCALQWSGHATLSFCAIAMVGSANASQSVLVTLYPSVPLQWSDHATLSFCALHWWGQLVPVCPLMTELICCCCARDAQVFIGRSANRNSSVCSAVGSTLAIVPCSSQRNAVASKGMC